MKSHTQPFGGISAPRKFLFLIPLILLLLAPSARAGAPAPAAQDPDPPDSSAIPLDVPDVIVDEYVSDYVVTDGLIYWAYKCWGGEFRGPGYLRRMPSHGGGVLTLQTTTAANCYTFWWLNADETGVYYVNYETFTLEFRPTATPTSPTILANLNVNNDPIAQLDMDETYLYWIAGDGNIYRLPKTGGSPLSIRSGRVGLDDLEIWGDSLYWLEDSGLYICSRPGCTSGTQVSDDSGSKLSSFLLYVFWVTDTNPQTIRYRACFMGCDEDVLYTAPAAGSWYINRPSVGMCADGVNYCLYWEEYSTVVINGRVRRIPLSGGTAETLADNLLRGDNPTATDDQGVYFMLGSESSNGLGRLSFTATELYRNLVAHAWEVTQGLQSLDNDISLVAHKPTYVRLYPAIGGEQANFVQAWLEGERGGVPLPGSPLAPLNGPFAMGDTWLPNRDDMDTSFLFQLPDDWTTGNVTLRAVVDPRQIYADIDPADNLLSRTFSFTTVPPVCDIFIPVRTHTPAISTQTANFWRMIDLHRRIWPVPDVWVYHQSSDVAEVETCWWGIIPYPCYGPFELDEDTSWSDWYVDDEEALMHVSTRSVFSDDPDECDDLGSAIHYIGMVHPDAPWGWGGLAYTSDLLQPASLVVMPPRTFNPPLTWDWPWEGSSLAHETAHNQERLHVDCGSPADPAYYPYPVCAIDDNLDPTHYGFDVNLRQPIPPDTASDVMSYSGSSQSATWEGRWISDYTYTALFGRMDRILSQPPPGPLALTAGDASVLISASIDPLSGQGELSPAWVYPVDDLSRGLQEKWQALQADDYDPARSSSAATSYHVRLRNASGATLADLALTPLATEVHQTETRNLTFLQTFPAPDGIVTRLDLMADSQVLASLQPGPAAPTITILAPSGGETFTDSMTISWQATDADPGDGLLFNILYSPDDGLTWKSVAANLPADPNAATQTLILDDLGGLGASNGALGLLSIAATDGYHTTLVQSAHFTVADQPPQAYILSPASTTYYAPWETVPLRGGASDPETGALNGSQLHWFVAENPAGTGAEINLYGLAPGTYPVTLEAADPAANTASASAYLNISRLEVPLGSPAPTLNGVCDDPQYTGVTLNLEPYAGDGQASVKLLRTSDALWACFGNMLRSTASFIGYAGLLVDVDNSRDAQAQPGDYGFFASENGTPLTYAGNGAGGLAPITLSGYTAQISSDGVYWNAELRITADLLGDWNHPSGLMLEQLLRIGGSWQHQPWPYAALDSQPNTWAWSILGDLPAITSLTPDTVTAGDPTFTLTITGEHFQDGAVVRGNAIALPTTFISTAELRATVDASLVANAAYALITVANPDGLTSNAAVFTIQNPVPAITTLDPPRVSAGSPDTTVTIHGSHFVANSRVYWDGEELPTTFVNSTTLQVELPTGRLVLAGVVQVVVVNPQPAGGQSAPAQFAIERTGLLFLPVVER